jgi:hypothetical protein
MYQMACKKAVDSKSVRKKATGAGEKFLDGEFLGDRATRDLYGWFGCPAKKAYRIRLPRGMLFAPSWGSSVTKTESI